MPISKRNLCGKIYSMKCKSAFFWISQATAKVSLKRTAFFSSKLGRQKSCYKTISGPAILMIFFLLTGKLLFTINLR